MNQSILRYITLGLALVSSHIVKAGPPMLDSRTFPGTPEGTAEAKWIAPFVLSSNSSVGGRGDRKICWYDEQGNIVKEIAGRYVNVNGSEVSERVGKETIIHGLRGMWQFSLPTKNNPDVRGVPNNCEANDTFVQQYSPEPGQTEVDVYASGQFVGSAGPFLDHRWGEAHVGDNGCITLITWKDEQKTTSQVVVIGPDAKIRVRMDCGEHTVFPFPVADGKGVLLEVEAQKRPPVQFMYVGADGTHVLFDLGANARPLSSVAGNDLVLFSTSLKVERFQVVHAATGEVVWDIASPVREFPNAATQGMVVGDKVYLLGLDVAVLDLKSGKVIALWQQQKSQPTFGRFFEKDGGVYIISDQEFFRLDPADIAAHRNGWQ